jgi:cytoskeletal protein CcmA (bactofilin family)
MSQIGRIRWVALLLFLLGIGVAVQEQGLSLPWAPSVALAAARQRENDCTNRHHEPSFGGTVVVDTGELVCGDLTAFGGTIAINGEVLGDVVTFGGNVVVAGKVDGNIDLYGGTVTLQSGSHVHGDINLYAGDCTKGNGAQLDGAVIYHTRHVVGWLFFNRGEFHFPFWPILAWVALGLLLTSLLPEHVMFVRTTVVIKPQRSLLIGLLSALLTVPVLIVLVALILTIPLAIIVALGLLAAWAFGTVAIGWVVGDHVIRMLAPHSAYCNKRPVQVVVGLTVLVLAGSLPYVGCWISIGAGLLGLGAVFLSRFGTRLYSQPKQPLTL